MRPNQIVSELLSRRRKLLGQPALLADRAHEVNETRGMARQLSYQPVIPPRSRRARPWSDDRRRYRGRHSIERLFRRLKRFRRVHVRYDKLDIICLSFVYLALIYSALQ